VAIVPSSHGFYQHLHPNADPSSVSPTLVTRKDTPSLHTASPPLGLEEDTTLRFGRRWCSRWVMRRTIGALGTDGVASLLHRTVLASFSCRSCWSRHRGGGGEVLYCVVVVCECPGPPFCLLGFLYEFINITVSQSVDLISYFESSFLLRDLHLHLHLLLNSSYYKKRRVWSIVTALIARTHLLIPFSTFSAPPALTSSISSDVLAHYAYVCGKYMSVKIYHDLFKRQYRKKWAKYKRNGDKMCVREERFTILHKNTKLIMEGLFFNY